MKFIGKVHRLFYGYMKCLCGMVFLLMVSVLCPAQDSHSLRFDRFYSENIQISKGLSQNSVHCILQDNKGYMWFGTWDGLNKYDGYSFRVYNHENGLSDPTITALMQDQEGNLWVGTDNGLNCYNRNTNHFEVFKQDRASSNSLIDNSVTALLEDRAGYLWIGTESGLSRYDKRRHQFVSYLDSPFENTPLRSNRINCLAQDEKGNIWIGTQKGLLRLHVENNRITRFFHIPDDSTSLLADRVLSVLTEKSGIVWVGTENGLCQYSDSTRRFAAWPSLGDVDEGAVPVNTLCRDQMGNLWIGTENQGLFIYSSQTKTTTRYVYQVGISNSISNNNIRTVYEDAGGTMWVGTFMGLNKLDRHSSKFMHYSANSDNRNSLTSNYVMGFYQDASGLLWVATGDGLNLFDKQSGLFRSFRHQAGNNKSLSSNELRAVCGDSAGRIWVGTKAHGLCVRDPQTGHFKHYRHRPRDPNSLSDDHVLGLYLDRNELLWVCTRKGLNRLNPITGEISRFYHQPGNQHSLSDNTVWSAMEDSKGQLWVCTHNGINKFSPGDESFSTYYSLGTEVMGSPAKEVFAMMEDRSGDFWLCTKGRGLVHFSPANNTFTSFTDKQGLPNNVVYAALEDQDQHLWISTNWGLSRFDPVTRSFVNYDARDGVQGFEFNHNAYLQTKDGELFFGGMNGFNAFFPHQICQNNAIPHTVVTEFKVFNKTRVMDPDNGDTIRLGYRDNFFSFSFSALDYNNPAKHLYKYQLENVDKELISTTASKRNADYTNVAPGTYRFFVKGSNNDGIWDEFGFRLIVIIAPPWYQTWMFRLILMLLSGGTIWGGIAWRIRRIHQKHEVEKKILGVEKQLYDLELRALRLQMNPHFIFNSMNSIQSFVLANDTDLAVNYLAKFSQLMRWVLVNSQKQLIPLADEIKALQYYLEIEKMRFEGKFDFSLTVDPQLDTEYLEIPPLIGQPYVENAIIHGLMNKGGGGQLDIQFSLKGNTLLWSITDNGIGREAARRIKSQSGLKQKSRGMLITQERFEVLNRRNEEYYTVRVIDLKDADGQACGTRVEIVIVFLEV